MSKASALLQRLLKSMKQSDIAKRTGIAQPKLSRWAAGATPAGAEDALTLAALEARIKKGAKP